ncbi:MAG TPA: hypothetical protein VM639_09540 [Dongiaceae bacterium]|nr:hypothetical protein [Dongiaceae bacterium]
MAVGIGAYNAATAAAIAPALTDPASSSAASSGSASSSTSSKTSSGSSTGSAASSSSGDQVSLSPQAQQIVSAANRGALVFDSQGATVGGKRVALIDIIDSTDGTYTDTEREAAVRQLNQRETAGFRWSAPNSQDPTALKQYYATYLSYLNKLSPEEQNSSRYKGEIDHAKQLIKDSDRQIAMNNIQSFTLASYSGDSMGLFGPLMSKISQQISQQLAGLPNTNLTTTARFYQAITNLPRTADQVLASPDPAGDSSDSGDGTSSSGGTSGSPTSGGVSVQA